MPKTILLRNVPERLYHQLVRRAEAAGLTLNDYIPRLLELEMSRPPGAEVFERVARRPRVNLTTPAADHLRKDRRHRDGS